MKAYPNCHTCHKPNEVPSFPGSVECRPCWDAYVAGKEAKNEAALKDPRVAAVRADKAVGEGSCSSIDECYEHHELLERLDENGVKTPREAVKWAREVDGGYWESGLNQMSGEPETDDPIREMHAESKARNKLPIKA